MVACLIVKMRLDLPCGNALLLALLGIPADPARPSLTLAPCSKLAS